MPNWCFTAYKFYSPEGHVEDITNFATEVEKSFSIQNNSDFGDRWLGNVLSQFGYDLDAVERTHARFRGWVASYELEKGVFTVCTETAWEPMLDMWDLIIKDKYTPEDGKPLIEYVYSAEEFGCCYFATNDVSGTFFPERYVVDYSVKTVGTLVESELLYLKTEEDVLKVVNSFNFPKVFTSIEEFNEWAETKPEELSGDFYCCIHNVCISEK